MSDNNEFVREEHEKPVKPVVGTEPTKDEVNGEEMVPVTPASVRPPPEISDSMKERLRRESQSLGGDPNVAGANPILIISAIIGILVIAGGKGILY